MKNEKNQNEKLENSSQNIPTPLATTMEIKDPEPAQPPTEEPPAPPLPPPIVITTFSLVKVLFEMSHSGSTDIKATLLKE